MRRRKVIFTPIARRDLLAINEWIAERTSSRVADRYVDRLERYVLGFDLASERGTKRSSGLRAVGFESSATILFSVDDREVHILRIFYAGQDWTAAFGDDEGPA